MSGLWPYLDDGCLRLQKSSAASVELSCGGPKPQSQGRKLQVRDRRRPRWTQKYVKAALRASCRSSWKIRARSILNKRLILPTGLRLLLIPRILGDPPLLNGWAAHICAIGCAKSRHWF